MDYLQALNPEQREAVEYQGGPMLVLAGAGSGKTRVLTHRIAYLIHQRVVDPTQIFAVTFTNKAAAEMRQRALGLVTGATARPVYDNELWISTFHAACVRILRSDIHHLGYNNQFLIYDDGDQLSVVKACMKELNVAESSFNPKSIQARINQVKNEGRDHTTYEPTYGGPLEDVFVRVFERYTEVLRASSALDFADLILLTIQLFQQHERTLRAYQERFHHLLIDEYQDTNRCQYLLMKLLAGERANICAVGDEDQSIYRWRGADISNILNFESDYPSTKIFKLEQNYRSTKTIIEAASHVIAHNLERREKELWTENPQGEKIRLSETYDEHDEANNVGQEILDMISADYSANQLAIFYRTNAQSRLMEDALRNRGVNYQIYGGLKFYSRLEVKDALAYMRLLVNPDDDVSFRRILNVPGRGIGRVSLDRLSRAAQIRQLTLSRLMEAIFSSRTVVDCDLGRARKKFQGFFDLIEVLRKEKDNLLPSDYLNLVLEESGYRRKLNEQHDTESQSRLENLAQLQQSMVEYELRCGAENPNERITLEGYLEQIALVSSIDSFDADSPAVKMMTIHMAKGLEFDVVFIVGLEEELFPNIRPWEGEEPSEVEEERRLFYVGMTRARQKLHILFAKNRTVFGTARFRVMSRFLEEVPPRFLDVKKSDYFARRRPYADRPGLPQKRSPLSEDFDRDHSQINPDDDDYSQVGDDDGFRRGSRVVHPLFGEGVVRKTIGKDKLMVEFRSGGIKKMASKFFQGGGA